MKYISVTWQDSESENGWIDRTTFDPAIPPLLVETVGFLVYNGDKHIAVVQSINEDEIGDVIKIPTCLIRKKKLLK